MVYHILFVWGLCSVPPACFLASQTYMRRHHTEGVSQLRRSTPAEMVLRYAFDRGNPARAAASEAVTARQLELFLRRFGPMRLCLVKAAR